MKSIFVIIMAHLLFLSPVLSEQAHCRSLFSAIKDGELEEVRGLIKEGADINEKDANGNTPLLKACEHGRADLVELLIKAGARVNAWNDSRISPIIAATWAASEPFQFNRTRAFNAQSLENRNPEQRERIVALLLENQAGLRSKGPSDVTPLMGASALGLTEAVSELLDHGADPNEKTKSSATALHFAAANGWANIVQLLLLAGASPLSEDSHGRTPLSMAASRGHTKAAKVIMDTGISGGLVKEAIDRARANGYDNLARLISERLEKEKAKETTWLEEEEKEEPLYSESERTKEGIAKSEISARTLYAKFKAIVIGMRAHDPDPVKKANWKGLFGFCVCRGEPSSIAYKYVVDWRWQKGERTELMERVVELAESRCGGCIKAPVIQVEKAEE
jgi:ankyrin repeat protein